jgi:integrase
MHEGLIGANLFANTNKPATNAARERTPSDAELCAIWRALGNDGRQYATIVRLIMLTGTRRDEIGALRWSETDLDAALITLPPERVKNGRKVGREQEIPLSDPALAILKAIPRRTNPDGSPRDLVFGNGQGGFSDWGGNKRELDARLLGMPKWVLHDLRRSMSTTMHERLGVQPHIGEECLGHTTFKSGVRGVYNTAQYRNEKRRALGLWAEHLMAVVENREQTVVSLQPKSA